MICPLCNQPFEVGVSGVVSEGGDELTICDTCAGVVRQMNGFFYEARQPFMINRLVSSAFLEASGPRPGDTVSVHPNRMSKISRKIMEKGHKKGHRK